MTSLFDFDSVAYSAPASDPAAGPIPIISDATFNIPPGVLAVITGPSGSGKSTLLRLFNRLADPTSGVIRFDGRDIHEYPVMDLRRRIGWVPQVPVRFPGTVQENLRLPFTLSKDVTREKEEIEKRLSELKALGLLPGNLFERKAEDLSVGEAQRLNLLRALALEPDVMLLDEPTSALDPEAADRLLDHIREIKGTRNLTTVMVSHRPDEVRRMGELVLKVSNGKVRAVDREGDEGNV